MEVPVLAQRLINGEYESPERREANRHRNPGTADEQHFTLFLGGEEFLWDIRAVG
jgi:hypothetical protein